MQAYLDFCRRIEETVGAVYRHWAETQDCSEELREFWRKLAMEEEQHAGQLQFAARLVAAEDVGTATLTGGELQDMLAQAEEVLREARSRNLDAKTALRLALRLEEGFQSLHAVNAMNFSDPELRRLFAGLAAGDEQHVAAVRQRYHDLLGA